MMVLFGRWVPGVRSLVAIPAGVLRMPRAEYIGLTLIGSLVWNTVLITAGYLLGTQWERVSDAIGPVAKPLLVVVFLAAGAALVWRALRRRRGLR